MGRRRSASRSTNSTRTRKSGWLRSIRGRSFFWGGEETKISRNNDGMKIKRQRRNAENAEPREEKARSIRLRSGQVVSRPCTENSEKWGHEFAAARGPVWSARQTSLRREPNSPSSLSPFISWKKTKQIPRCARDDESYRIVNCCWGGIRCSRRGVRETGIRREGENLPDLIVARGRR